ncbi:MAG: asparagine synthase (glutamine-hydrolyzing) [Chloroflexota bacterium]
MCGIAGVAYADGRPGDGASVAAMCARMVHRGPDDEGLFEAPGVAIGARRLSIVDLAGGHQPMTGQDGNITVAQNGEIYNYPELRRELESRGYRFRTNCDTEALLHGYTAWGDGLVDRLNGMFAIAVWERDRRRLLLARDRMGIKPLYYTQSGGRLAFASELKALMAVPGVAEVLDPVGLRDYLIYEYVPTPRTMLKDVYRLPPGHCAVFEDGSLRISRYWDLKLDGHAGSQKPDEAELARELRERIREAVRLELLSDVPLGVLLSGGIDSSTIAATMAEEGVTPLQTFSVGFQEASFDETRYARLVADSIGSTHHTLMVGPDDVSDLVPRLGEIVDEPLGDSSIVPTYLLSRFARERVTVALGGEGGDEVFGGYPTLQAHQIARWAEYVPGPVLSAARALADRLPSDSRNISLDFKLRRFFAGMSYSRAQRHHVWMGSLAPAAADLLLVPAMRAEVRGRDAFAVLDEHLSQLGKSDPLDEVLYLDTKMYLENDILVKTDRASMACSLETRVPLLNRVLVDFMAGLPSRYKVRGLETKYLLKRAVADLLPASIVNRRKKGFNFPVAATLRTTLRPLLLDVLSDDHLRRQGLFDPAQVGRLVREHLDGRMDHRKPLWTLVMFQLWHARFLADRGGPGVAQPSALATAGA